MKDLRISFLIEHCANAVAAANLCLTSEVIDPVLGIADYEPYDELVEFIVKLSRSETALMVGLGYLQTALCHLQSLLDGNVLASISLH